MELQDYDLENWKELLEKDWEYLREDIQPGNIERIIESLLNLKKQYHL